MRTHVIDHPLVSHKLTTLRDEGTDSPTFRRLADELVTLLAYEATRDVRVEPVDILGLPPADDEDEQVPAGDLDLLGDLGMHAMDLAVLLDDVELYPDEMLSDIARRLGFGELFDDAVGFTSA